MLQELIDERFFANTNNLTQSCARKKASSRDGLRRGQRHSPDVNPYFAIKQILVSPFRNRLRDERTVRPELLLTNQVEGAGVMALS